MEWVAGNGKLPVPNFSAGGIATPADAALVMQFGAEAVFVGSEFQIVRSGDARQSHRQGGHVLQGPVKLLEASEELGEAMPGLDISKMPESELMQTGLVGSRAKEPMGVLASAGRFRGAPKALERAGAEAGAGAHGPELESSRWTGDPGGRKTTMLKLLSIEGLFEPLQQFGTTKADLRQVRGRHFAGHPRS